MSDRKWDSCSISTILRGHCNALMSSIAADLHVQAAAKQLLFKLVCLLIDVRLRCHDAHWRLYGSTLALRSEALDALFEGVQRTIALLNDRLARSRVSSANLSTSALACTLG